MAGKFAIGALLVGVVSLALGGIASAAGTLTDAEFKCQAKVSKAGSKFVGSKAKCAAKCWGLYWKALVPISDCQYPYGGATSQCIDDTVLDLKGAEDKFRLAIRKACDPTFKAGTDCPECYSGGDCTTGGEASDRVQNLEGQVDSFGPGVYCEPTTATPAEQKCEQSTAKSLAKLVGGVNKCYDKCYGNARKGIGTALACTPPSVTDGITVACISKVEGKTILSVDKLCKTISVIPTCAQIACNVDSDCDTAPAQGDGVCNNGAGPGNCTSGQGQYPDGQSWVNLVELSISGTVPTTYCESPSGAFIE